MSNWFYNKVIVISDNILQCQRMYQLIQKKHLGESLDIHWCCSKFSSAEKFESAIGIPFETIDLKDEETVHRITTKYQLVISMHCKQLFPPSLVSAVKCINIHPGYNPVNRGWYPQVFAIINDSIIGATIHEIDEELDHGNIIDRMEVPMFPWDSSLEIYNRVLEAEIILMDNNLEKILANKYTTVSPEEEGRLYLKKDFNALCKLDLAETDSLQGFINKLRALSHAPHKNAYFIDPKSGKKVFISIQLEPEN